MRSVLFLSLILWFTNAIADQLTLNWKPSLTREDGSAITGNTSFIVFLNGVEAYRGEETTFTSSISTGEPFWFEVYQLENEVRSRAATKRVFIDSSPPLPPQLINE